MRQPQKRRSEIIGFIGLVIVVCIVIFAYIDAQRKNSIIPEINTPELTDDEIDTTLKNFKEQNPTSTDASFPQTELSINNDSFIVAASNKDVTYFQVVSKSDPSTFTLSTLIPEKNVTSLDIIKDSSLVAYTTAYKDGVVSGLFIINGETLQKRVLIENSKDKKTVSDVLFSPNDNFLRFAVLENGVQTVQVFSLKENTFSTLEYDGLVLPVQFSEWTHQGKILAITEDNRLYISSSSDDPSVLEPMPLEIDKDVVLHSAYSSPKENSVVLFGSKREEGHDQNIILVYNIDSYKKIVELVLDSSDVGILWSLDGSTVYYTDNGNLFSLDRNNEFMKSKEALIENAGRINTHLDEQYTSFIKEYKNKDEQFLQLSIWNIETKTNVFSSEPLTFVRGF